jgi:flavodoxin
MKIGFIIYSYSGNTLKVANAIIEQMEKEGMITELNQVTAINDNPSNNTVVLDNIPQLLDYDGIVLATPVRGFMIAPVMKAYLNQLDNTRKQRIFLFVTHQFPWAWLGGLQTINKLTQILTSKGATIIGSEVISWSNAKRPSTISKLASQLSNRKLWMNKP